MNLLDGLLKVVIGDILWNYIHFILFLIFKPTVEYNGIFITSKYIYLKLFNSKDEELIQKYQTLNSNLSLLKPMVKNTGYFYPKGISQWLLQDLKIENDSFEILKVQLPFNMSYYKLPNPNQLILHSLKLY